MSTSIFFLIDNAPTNYLLRAGHGLISMALGFALSCRRFLTHKKEYLELAGDDTKIVFTFKTKALIGRVFSFLSVSTWCRLWDRWNGLIKNDTSRYVTIPVGRKHYFGETYPRASLFPISYGFFDGIEVMLPADSDAYLRNLYGPDYMTPPPEGEQERHVVFEYDMGMQVDVSPQLKQK